MWGLCGESDAWHKMRVLFSCCILGVFEETGIGPRRSAEWYHERGSEELRTCALFLTWLTDLARFVSRGGRTKRREYRVSMFRRAVM
jgi:hypothetical protein